MLQFLLQFYRWQLQGWYALSPKLGARRAFRLFATPMVKKVRQRERLILQKAEQTRLDLPSGSIAVYKWGNGSKRALLVHGWEGHAGSMGGMVAPLVDAGFTVYAFDGPAHGRSSGKRTNLLHFGDVVAHMLEYYAIRDLVITHSFGSATTVMTLYRFPRIAVDKLVMITSPDRLEDVLRAFAKVMQMTERQIKLLFQHIHHKFKIPVQDIAVNQLAPQINAKQALLIHDRGDKILPFRNSERIQSRWPQAQLHAIEGSGHYRILWDKQVIEGMLDFVKGIGVYTI